MRKAAAVLCLILLLPAFFVLCCKAREENTESNIQNLIAYYQNYQEAASAEIGDLLWKIEQEDPVQAEKLRSIMEQWSWINREMQINTESVPQDLPRDDSLCFVVMGYDLKDNGSMKDELLLRLEVALNCAREYPESFLVCTGGATSKKKGFTEAGEMKKWLVKAGVSEKRIITETKAKNTAQNAQKTYSILKKQYPQVNSVVLITSEYHMRRSMLVFSSVSIWEGSATERQPYAVISNAACTTGKTVKNELKSQADSVAAVLGVSMKEIPVPQLYVSAQTESTVLQTETVTELAEAESVAETAVTRERTGEPASVQEVPEDSRIPPVVLIGFVLFLVLAAILLAVLVLILWKRH